jgi:hypothetical protein
VIDEIGMPIVYYSRGESSVQRDKYDSLKRRTVVDGINMYAYPVTYNPIDKDLKKAGLREKVDVLIYTAMRDWNNNNINPEVDINAARASFKIRERTFTIKEYGLISQFQDTFLYATFGLVRR